MRITAWTAWSLAAALLLAIAAATFNLTAATPAYAYVDPSVMTYTIQALAGVAVAVGAVAGVAFRRTRRALFALFRIDENAGKIVEPPVTRQDGDGSDPSNLQLREEARMRNRTHDRLGRRIPLSIAVSLLAVLTLLVASPLEIYVGGQSDLSVDVFDIIPVLVPAAAAVFAVLTLLLCALRGRTFRVALAVVFALSVCCYIQALFLNTGLPAADGQPFTLSGHESIAVVSLLVWLLVFALALYLGLSRARPAQNAFVCLSLVLIVVQGAGLASLLADHAAENEATAAASESEDAEWYVTEDGLYDLSGTNNVVVFALDTFEDADITEALAADPSILDEFTGFTRYTDCLDLLEPTRYGLPFLLTGELPALDESFETYLYERYARSDFLDRIAQRGYSIGLYSESLLIEDITDETESERLRCLTVNLHGLQAEQTVDAAGALAILYRCALYRDLTWVCKAPFWFYTDEINQGVVRTDPDGNDAETLYTSDDVGYNEKLAAKGLRTNDEDSYSGAFRLIHLQGTHLPYSMDENCNDVGEGNSSKAKQARGTLKIVARYLAEMKKLGLYEDATVIVTCDHGGWHSSADTYTNAHSALMMVKPSGSGTGAPVINDAQVAQTNFQATVLAAIGADTQGFEPALQDVAPASRTRYYYQLIKGDYDEGIVQWEVSGSAVDAASWSQTGRAWVFKDGLLSVESYREALPEEGTDAGSGPAVEDATGIWPSAGKSDG